MSVDEKTVRRVARLARIKVADADLPRLAGELNVILNFVEQLNEVNVENVMPLTSVVAVDMRLRADVVTDGHMAKAVIMSAAASEDDFFMVPKVVE
jgi:aspartyl-tRNA(Asn)/glutamyl-tRNA(Gln) amidotransferase subunit C